ncbi:MAG: class I SAM-dependent methyltransferase [Reyranellaceae bacterium]
MSGSKEVQGASAEAIQAHYDVGNEFYALWLDLTLTYSAALWDSAEDARPLEWAQRNKIAWHLRAARAEKAKRVLDIGCGWGAVVTAAAGLPGVEQVMGLTLSRAQADHILRALPAKIDVRLESWAEHNPAQPYDSIVSIGAFEHFTRPDDDAAAKIAIYRDFFAKCRAWLNPKGGMSLQTIAYGKLRRDDPNVKLMAQIFPDSDLPRLEEIVAACEGLFEIVMLRNDRIDYARTCEQWANNLRAKRKEATALVGPEQVARYERYLKLSAFGFWTGNLALLRLELRPIE